MTELKVLSESEYTFIMVSIHNALSRLDLAALRDHTTVLYLLGDLIGAIDCAYEELPE